MSSAAFILLLINFLSVAEGKKFSATEVSKIFEAAAKSFDPKTELPTETLQCRQVVTTENGKNLTNYFLVQGNEEPDPKSVAAFSRKRDDGGKPWIYIPKDRDHLYKWETQTIVLLKQNLKSPKIYYILLVHFREIGPGQYVFEWDKWRPRGAYPVTECPCTMVDKFYHPCETWDYCKLLANTYELSSDDSGAKARRRRGADKKHKDKKDKKQDKTDKKPEARAMPKIPPKKDNDAEKTKDTGNEIPKGSVLAFGPFFWDIVDTPEEAVETNARIRKYQGNKTAVATYYEDQDDFPFSGYGDCPYEVKKEDFKNLMAEKEKDHKKVLDFYFKSLRAQCMKNEISDVQNVLTSKLIVWDEKLEHFIINQNHPLKKKASISDDELEQLEIAMHISSYSYLYPVVNKRILEEKEKNVTRDAASPLGFPIHRNTRMIVLMALRISDQIRNFFSRHEIKLTRRLISNIKNHLMLGLHSRMAFSAHATKTPKICTGTGANDTCSKTKEMFKKDTLQTVALTYFLLFGNDPTAPKEIQKLDSYSKFVQFYQYRIQFLEHHFSNYKS